MNKGVCFRNYNNDKKVDLISAKWAQTISSKIASLSWALAPRLHGPKKNPLAFGSSIQIEYSDGKGA